MPYFSYLKDFKTDFSTTVYGGSGTNTINSYGNDSIVVDKEGNIFNIDADTVITSMGYHPAPVFNKGKKIKYVGDCDKVGNLRTVIWGAWNVAMKI